MAWKNVAIPESSICTDMVVNSMPIKRSIAIRPLSPRNLLSEVLAKSTDELANQAINRAMKVLPR